MDHRKEWTRQQTQLRKLLNAKGCFEQGIQLFLQQHAAVHTRKISRALNWSLQDDALAGLTDAQIRVCPRPGDNSIAWLLWHTARIEDITLNFLVLEHRQVLLSGDWAVRLGISLRDVGAAMDANQVANLSAQISIPTLKAYRAAVGRSVQAGIGGLNEAQARARVSATTVQKLVKDGSISPNAPWLAEFYSNRPKVFFLTRITSHNFLHLSQAARARAKLLQCAAKETI